MKFKNIIYKINEIAQTPQGGGGVPPKKPTISPKEASERYKKNMPPQKPPTGTNVDKKA